MSALAIASPECHARPTDVPSVISSGFDDLVSPACSGPGGSPSHSAARFFSGGEHDARASHDSAIRSSTQLSCDFESCLSEVPTEAVHAYGHTEEQAALLAAETDDEEDPDAPLWDTTGRDHANQCKKGAHSDPKAYYMDAYYMAFLAKARGMSRSNPFGYDTVRGLREVVNEGHHYRIMEEDEFLELRRLADSTDGWVMRGEDTHSLRNVAKLDGPIIVWDRPPPDRSVTSFNMVKVFCVIEGLEPWTLYDTVHDCVYRWEWDTNMLEGYNVCNLDLHNDIGYYAAQSPTRLVTSRDFCNQRAWRNIDGNEFLVVNRSRPHPRCPDKKGFVRGSSICSGYLIRPHGRKSCSLTYIAQSDPKGSIPAWVVNSIITSQVPKTIANLAKVGRDYRQWKEASGHAHMRPWVVPPQSWSVPQPNHLLDWFVDRYPQLRPHGEPTSAPADWYAHCPAMEWYKPGAPLGPRMLKEVVGPTQQVDDVIRLDTSRRSATIPAAAEELAGMREPSDGTPLLGRGGSEDRGRKERREQRRDLRASRGAPYDSVSPRARRAPSPASPKGGACARCCLVM
eukprot:TRINITY_DN515_c0_g1_i1.p1 TRINITY_DN515_c0_g1~~TRINITY_DN515_c0_g1_i1.p1  ORF type:complete len:568 (+),score=132.19 TRINITY_DN515_c0_g1_i1:59-1762(+)